MDLDIRDCPPHLLDQALALIYSDHPASARDQLVRDAARILTAEPQSNLTIQVALSPGAVVAALVVERLGQTAAFWPPRAAHSEVGAGAVLVRKTLEALRAEGVRIVQCLPPNVAADARDSNLIDGGMRYVTQLFALRHTGAARAPAAASPFRWHAFSRDNADALRDTLALCLGESLDLPEIHEVQSADDVLESQRVSELDPALVLLGAIGATPCAVVLLGEDRDRATVEVRFLGLVPSMRQRGLGRHVIDWALYSGHERQPNVELSVDSRNVPAIRLYERAGFQVHDRRPLYLALFPLRNPSPESLVQSD